MPGTTSREPGQRVDSCTAAMFHVKLFGGLIEPGKVTAQPDNYAARLGMRALGAVDTRALGTWLIRRAPENQWQRIHAPAWYAAGSYALPDAAHGRYAEIPSAALGGMLPYRMRPTYCTL